MRNRNYFIVPWLLFDILIALPVFALVMFRLTGLMLTAPLFGSQVIPVRMRVAMVMTLAAMIFPLVKHQAPSDTTLGTVLVAGAGELMIGAIMGIVLSLMLSSAEVMGLLVSRQAGIALANVFDPTQNQNVSVIGQLYTIVFTMLFLMSGGLRAMIAALLDTYTVIPLLSFRFNESYMLLLIEALMGAFMLGIRLAGPVLIGLFLVGTALGFLSRTMPQLNILTIGFTIRAVVALGIAGVTLMFFEDVLLDAVWDSLGLVREGFGLEPSYAGLVN